MLDRADAILKLALAVAALTVGFAVGYYYALFLPDQAQRSADRAASVEKEKREEATKAENNRRQSATMAKADLDSCLAGAQLDYSLRWESSCKSQHDRQAKAKADCYSSSWQANCEAYEVQSAKDCTLPSNTASSYDAGLQSAKQLCLDKFKVAGF